MFLINVRGSVAVNLPSESIPKTYAIILLFSSETPTLKGVPYFGGRFNIFAT